MSLHKSPEEMIAHTRNLARASVEYPQLVWMFLIICLLAGFFAYRGLPQRKDPDIPNKIASITCPWPGASPEKMDELVATLKKDHPTNLNADYFGAPATAPAPAAPTAPAAPAPTAPVPQAK